MQTATAPEARHILMRAYSHRQTDWLWWLRGKAMEMVLTCIGGMQLQHSYTQQYCSYCALQHTTLMIDGSAKLQRRPAVCNATCNVCLSCTCAAARQWHLDVVWICNMQTGHTTESNSNSGCIPCTQEGSVPQMPSDHSLHHNKHHRVLVWAAMPQVPDLNHAVKCSPQFLQSRRCLSNS